MVLFPKDTKRFSKSRRYLQQLYFWKTKRIEKMLVTPIFTVLTTSVWYPISFGRYFPPIMYICLRPSFTAHHISRLDYDRAHQCKISRGQFSISLEFVYFLRYHYIISLILYKRSVSLFTHIHGRISFSYLL